MLVDCEIDCGEVLPGHRLIARGLRDDGYSDDDNNGDFMHHHEGKPVHRVVSVVYALVPGLSEPEDDVSLDVDATVVLDPAPDPEVWGSVLTLGGERDARPGGSETAGAFGPFVFPEATERVIVRLSRITVARSGAPFPAQAADERRLGALEVDMSSGAAHWEPADEAD
ncbi:MAG: hypothetical protein ACK4V6_16255 [Microthrixaceae bacterium]